jgi:hypothetical protein
VRDSDAILVPGGGLTPDGTPTEWVKSRLDSAVRNWAGQWIITLSAGTTHKPPPLDRDGFPVHESVAGVEYLASRGIPEDRLLYETASYDTIGNAYFARVVHADPMGLRNLLVITSEFHMPRTRAVFDWVFGLPPSGYTVTYETTANDGIDESSLSARIAKEEQGLRGVERLRDSIRTLHDVHRWLFAEHSAYSAVRPAPSAGDAGGTY